MVNHSIFSQLPASHLVRLSSLPGLNFIVEYLSHFLTKLTNFHTLLCSCCIFPVNSSIKSLPHLCFLLPGASGEYYTKIITNAHTRTSQCLFTNMLCYVLSASLRNERLPQESRSSHIHMYIYYQKHLELYIKRQDRVDHWEKILMFC